MYKNGPADYVSYLPINHSGAGGFGSTGVSEAVSGENGNKRLKQGGEAAMDGACVRVCLMTFGCTRKSPSRSVPGFPSHLNFPLMHPYTGVHAHTCTCQQSSTASPSPGIRARSS